MIFFKQRKIQQEMREDLNRLVVIEKELYEKRRAEDMKNFIKKNEIENKMHTARKAEWAAEERARKELNYEKDLATQWIPHIAAAFIRTDPDDPIEMDDEGREKIAKATSQMVIELMIDWLDSATKLEKAHKATWKEEVFDELGSA